MVLLGVNIDHVATLRNARGGGCPDPVEAALLAEAHGADGITAHLREDRRHIRDADIDCLKSRIRTRLNLEMAATEEMVAIACRVKPGMVTLVPERREELTTEGGLDVARHASHLRQVVLDLHASDIVVSLFIDPDPLQIKAAAATGAHWIELHTGPYAHASTKAVQPHVISELTLLKTAAAEASRLGLHVNAGHGLTFQNVVPVLQLPGLLELNIGHSLVSDAILMGLGPAVSRMKDVLKDSAMQDTRLPVIMNPS
jgi:pyridoxine 5-phosphate synthase